jgi:branched-chain amino acid transport system substrate-binding protein
MRNRIWLAAAALAAGVVIAPASAADVKIGAIYPLSGNAANAGRSALEAIQLAVDIINNPHPDLAALPSVGPGGLSNLGGAKIVLIAADHQGNPAEGQSQTLRLITQEKVAAMLGVYQSNVAFTATATAERYGVPFIVGDSVAANITGRGFKWTFRTTPIASDFAANYMQFLADMKQAGHKVDSVAIVNENTDYGTSVGGTVLAQAKAHGINVVAQIPYSANATDVTAQVLQLKSKNPDVVVFISYTADAILYMKTMKNLDYMPQMVIADDAGFSDPTFVPSVGNLAQGLMNRSTWAVG